MRRPPSEWDEMYEEGAYLEHWEMSEPSPELVAALATGLASAGDRVLDLGCGAGTEAIFLASRGLETWGVDPSGAALAIARERAGREEVEVAWCRAEAGALPLAGETFDLVCDRGCFHHVAEADRPAYAREVARVLRPGGALLLRGCRALEPGAEFFVPVTEEAVRRHFPAVGLDPGPVLPLTLHSDEGELSAHVVCVRKPGPGS